VRLVYGLPELELRGGDGRAGGVGAVWRARGGDAAWWAGSEDVGAGKRAGDWRALEARLHGGDGGIESVMMHGRDAF
jgi:hypothetical protein